MLIVLSASPAASFAAEEAGKDDYWRVGNKEYWKGYIRDTGSVLTAPARWERSDWIRASLVVGTTAGLFFLDEEIKEWAQEERNGVTDGIASVAKPFGDPRYVLPPVAALYLYGHVADEPRSRRAALLSLESMAVTGLFTQALKFSFGRHRPSSGDPPDTFDGPGISGKNLAFPSGHSSFAWSVMTVIAHEYRDKPAVPPLAYGIATLTALSRVNDNAHWASDAFFGSALGYFTARAIISIHEGDKDSRVALLPLTDGDRTGLILFHEF